jgi:hypothetical protein
MIMTAAGFLIDGPFDPPSMNFHKSSPPSSFFYLSIILEVFYILKGRECYFYKKIRSFSS